jgi:hypothetical protein
MAYRGQGVCDLFCSALGDPRNVGSWHKAEVRCNAAFLPLLNELQTELAKGRDKPGIS